MDIDTLSEYDRTFKILVVDDDEDNLLLITYQLLQMINCVVISAKDGYSALSTAQESQPNLILLDIMMPQMNGFEVVRRLKQDSQTQAIPVVAVTAMARPEDRELALQSGCDAYLIKPYALEDLIEIITRYLQETSESSLETDCEVRGEEGGAEVSMQQLQIVFTSRT